MKYISITMLCAALLLSEANVVPCYADEGGENLPFDPTKISRLSLDGIPRSLSIRQGADVWIGYDLEKAMVFKVWQAPKDKSGLIVKSFKAISEGTPWFEKKEGKGWHLTGPEKTKPLTVRYLGCTQAGEHFQLGWELSHSEGTVILTERIPTAPANGAVRAYRELRVESLKAGTSLSLPQVDGKRWILTDPEGNSVSSLTGKSWHRLSLR